MYLYTYIYICIYKVASLLRATLPKEKKKIQTSACFIRQRKRRRGEGEGKKRREKEEEEERRRRKKKREENLMYGNFDFLFLSLYISPPPLSNQPASMLASCTAASQPCWLGCCASLGWLLAKPKRKKKKKKVKQKKERRKERKREGKKLKFKTNRPGMAKWRES